MLESVSRGDLVRVLDLATRCLSAVTTADLGSIVSALGEVVPFQKAALCAIRARPQEPSLVHYVNHSYGADWAKLYMTERFETVDPVLAYGRTNSGAFRWKDASLHANDRAAATFFEAARDFGLVDGVSYGCTSGREELRTVLSLSKVGAGDDRALSILAVMGPHLHEAYRRVLGDRSEGQRSPPLSAREAEILGWTQQGKTYWEIGCILGISQRTVKYHFARIKEKLDAVSPSHAVAMAMRLGILS